MKLTHNQSNKLVAYLHIANLAIISLLVMGLSPNYEDYMNYKIFYQPLHQFVDIRDVTSTLYVIPAMWWVLYSLFFPMKNKKYVSLVFLSMFLVITVFYWLLYQIDNGLLASAIVVSVINVVNVLIYIFSEYSLLLMNPTKYQYFDHTSFYASDERKTEMFVEKDINELLWYIDKLAPSKDDKTYLVTQNSYLHGLLSCVKETQYVLKRKDYNYVIKKLDEYIGDGGIEVLKAYEAKAIIESCSIVIDKD